MQIRKFSSQQTMQWLYCGTRFWRRAPVLWTAVALIDLILIYLVEQIPIMGYPVLLFLAPAALVSGLTRTRQLVGAQEAAAIRGWKQRLLSPFPAAFGVYATANEALVIAVAGGVALVVGLLIQMLYQLIGGSALDIPGMLYEMGIVNALRYLGAYLVAWLLAAPIIVYFVYALPLIFFEEVPMGEALLLAARALLKNGVALIPFSASLLGPLVIALLAFKLYWNAGFVLTAIAGFVLIPLWINSAYCSYKLTFH